MTVERCSSFITQTSDLRSAHLGQWSVRLNLLASLVSMELSEASVTCLRENPAFVALVATGNCVTL